MNNMAECDSLLDKSKDGGLPSAIHVVSGSGGGRPGEAKTYLPKNSRVTSIILRQVLAASGPVIATVGSGMTSGFSAVLLPQLRADDSSLPVSDEDASWIASMAALPMAVGCLAGGFAMERAGRRCTNKMLCVPFVLGWLLLAVAGDLRTLLAGRFLTGLAVGALGPVGLVYIGETSAPQYRGVLLAAVSLAVSLGILLAHVLGALLSWRLAAGLCAIAPALALVLAYLVPESPAWLIARGRRHDAEEAFRWLRGSGAEATAELQGLLHHQQSPAGRAPLSQQLLRPSFIKPFFIMNVFFIIQQFSGVNAVAFYTVSIFKQTLSAGGSSVNEYVAMGILDFARLVMSVITCILLRRLGRRPLALTSAVGTALSLLSLAAFLQYGTGMSENVLVAWLPVILLVAYMCFVSVGLVPLPWIMTGELFPAAVRGIGSGSTSCLGFLVFFSVVKTGPAMFNNLGSEGTFMVYGLVAAVGAVFLYFCCPETKNRTLQDIENTFDGRPIAEKSIVKV